MLSEDLTHLGETIEGWRFTADMGVELDAAETDLLLAAIYTAAEDAEALEAAQVGGQARGDSGKLIAFDSPHRRAAVKRLADTARAAAIKAALARVHTVQTPTNGGDVA